MQSDIIPPNQRSGKKTKRQTMKSTRLRGHSLSDARQRLLGIKAFMPSDLPALEDRAVNLKQLPIAKKDASTEMPWWRRWGKKKKIAAGIIAGLVVFSATGLVYAQFFRKPDKPIVKSTPIKVAAEPPPKPKTVASPLSGVQVAPELAARPVTGVMIENSIAARPQSGLSDAGVVFEAIAEGGITRFLALFQESRPQNIGPVRSLRPYYIDLARPFDAGIAHVGGSPDALAQIRGGAAKDLDQFLNSGAYWRASSRRAPHNVYTSFDKLDTLNQQKGFTGSKFTVWPRKEDKPSAAPTAKSIEMSISSASYNTRYDYNAACNCYPRSLGGRAHISTAAEADGSGQQLKPKVVLALVTPYSLAGKYSVYNLSGGGELIAFQDGEVINGRWNKAGREGQFSFTDATGKPLQLNAGQTWVTLIASASRVSYQP